MQPAIAEPALFGCQLSQPAAQGVVARPRGSITHGLAIGLYQAARLALAPLVGGYETDDSLALDGGRIGFSSGRDAADEKLRQPTLRLFSQPTPTCPHPTTLDLLVDRV